MKHVHLPMYEDQYYYIFNRGNNSSPIFYTKANYNFFLYQLNAFLHNYLNFYAFNLLRSEFHLIVRVKNFDLLTEKSKTLTKGRFLLFLPHQILSEQFRKFFICYSKAINKQEKNTGSVFEKNFKRVHIADPALLSDIICSIHNKSGTVKGETISSYSSIISGETCLVNRTEILNRFGGINSFVEAHTQDINSPLVTK